MHSTTLTEKREIGAKARDTLIQFRTLSHRASTEFPLRLSRPFITISPLWRNMKTLTHHGSSSSFSSGFPSNRKIAESFTDHCYLQTGLESALKTCHRRSPTRDSRRRHHLNRTVRYYITYVTRVRVWVQDVLSITISYSCWAIIIQCNIVLCRTLEYASLAARLLPLNHVPPKYRILQVMVWISYELCKRNHLCSGCLWKPHLIAHG